MAELLEFTEVSILRKLTGIFDWIEYSQSRALSGHLFSSQLSCPCHTRCEEIALMNMDGTMNLDSWVQPYELCFVH